jgi:hypothetical protein
MQAVSDGADRTSLSPTSEIGVRELDRRSNDGLDVSVLWNPRTDRVLLVVEDESTGDSFGIDVDAADALDASRHPHAYADLLPRAAGAGRRTLCGFPRVEQRHPASFEVGAVARDDSEAEIAD